MVRAAFGNEGVDAVFRIMGTAQKLYRHVELERIAGEIIIYEQIHGATPTIDALESRRPFDFSGYATLESRDLILEVTSDGLTYQSTLHDSTVEQLAESAVVYRWSKEGDEFLAGSERKRVVKLDPSALSQFAVPTLYDLREALDRYAAENVRESTCYIFNGAWFDSRRLFFKAAPETIMRRSVTQFLRNRLGANHDVWPEQNVDESHPVDIRVVPRFANNRVMLIEIKWLGCSAAVDGHITARHFTSRAQEGEDQLAEYLDDQQQSAPTSVIHGYYVIIDGRRRNLKEHATSIARADGMYYENEEIQFSRAHHEVRSDFDPPFRMFARPICNS